MVSSVEYIQVHPNITLRCFIRSGEPDAPQLLFLHGFASSGFRFTEGIFNFLPQNWTLAAFDFPGFGGSAPLAGHTTLDCFRDIALALCDKLNYKSPFIFGMSMGGTVAIKVADKMPERFSGLILQGAGTWGIDRFIPSFSLFTYFLSMRARAFPTLATWEKNIWLPRMLEAWFGKDERRAQYIAASSVITLLDCSTDIARLNIIPLLARLRLSTFVIDGADKIYPGIHTPRELSYIIPQQYFAGSALIPNASHLVTFQNPLAAAEAVRTFVERKIQLVHSKNII